MELQSAEPAAVVANEANAVVVDSALMKVQLAKEKQGAAPRALPTESES
jgi:hypothetical protein